MYELTFDDNSDELIIAVTGSGYKVNLKISTINIFKNIYLVQLQKI